MDTFLLNVSSNFTARASGESLFSYGLFVVFLVLFIPSAIFNIVLIITVVTHRVLRTPTSVFMCSLAVSDFFYAIVVNVFAGYGVVDQTALFQNPVILRFLENCWWFTTVAHYNCFVAMCVERWLYIARPFLHQRFVGRKFISASMIFIWTVSVMSSIPYSIVEGNTNFYLAYILPFAHIVSCVVVAGVYIHIVVITRRQIRAILATAPQGTLKENLPTSRLRHWRAVRLLLVVFGIFVMTLTPYVCYNSLSLNEYLPKSQELSNYLLLLSSLHYTSNFPVYIALHRKFRSVVKARTFGIKGFFRSNNRIHHMTSNSYS